MKHYKFMLLKGYFEKGYALTSYVKYLIALVGFGEIMIRQSYFWVIMLGLAYGLSCFFIGYIWFRYGFVEAENEVNNRFNLFVKEMRELSGSPINQKV